MHPKNYFGINNLLSFEQWTRTGVLVLDCSAGKWKLVWKIEKSNLFKLARKGNLDGALDAVLTFRGVTALLSVTLLNFRKVDCKWLDVHIFSTWNRIWNRSQTTRSLRNAWMQRWLWSVEGISTKFESHSTLYFQINCCCWGHRNIDFSEFRFKLS